MLQVLRLKKLSNRLTNPSIVKKMLKDESIELKPQLGQNFLVNQKIIEKIVELADANKNDIILEVGPGIGTLTSSLLETGAKVIAIEKDLRLKKLLVENTDFAKERFILVEGDALKCKNVSDIACAEKFVANLPYNIAATLILDYFQIFKNIKSATVMVQKEVAERIMAKEGTKNYGAYTVKLSLYADVADHFFVGRNNFLPAPHVDSCVVRLNREDLGSKEETLKMACTVADAAFFNRRKTILNSTATYFADFEGFRGVGKKRIQEWLEKCGIDERSRGETLSKEDFILLAKSVDILQN